MKLQYVRIQGREYSWTTQYPKGVFSMCWRLIYDGKMSAADENTFREIDQWFKENLPEPEPCKNGEKVITFFKAASTEEMRQKLAPALELLDKYQQPFDVVWTNSVGTIVYEDRWQIAVKVEDGKMV